jgi:hypothetical protein
VGYQVNGPQMLAIFLKLDVRVTEEKKEFY